MFLLSKQSGRSGVLYNPNSVFSAKTYTGTGATATIVNNVDITSGGMVLIKNKGVVSEFFVFDSARGVDKGLSINTAIQGTLSTSLTGFGSTGFTIGANGNINTTSGSYISCAFKKAAKFFDIISYNTNAPTHSLAVAPEFILTKNCTHPDDWIVYHKSLTTGNVLALNSSSAAYSKTFYSNITASSLGCAITSYSSVASVTVNAGGSNYTSNPTVSFSGGGGSGATATANLSVTSSTGNDPYNGRVGSVSISGGSYSSTGTQLSISQGSATATITISALNMSSPIYTLSGGGVITAVPLPTSNSFNSTPSLTFSGGGSGASATANMTATNRQVSIATATDVYYTSTGNKAFTATGTSPVTGYFTTSSNVAGYYRNGDVILNAAASTIYLTSTTNVAYSLDAAGSFLTGYETNFTGVYSQTNLTVSKVIAGLTYTVLSVGTSTLAQWKAKFSGLNSIPTVNQSITATLTGIMAAPTGGTVPTLQTQSLYYLTSLTTGQSTIITAQMNPAIRGNYSNTVTLDADGSTNANTIVGTLNNPTAVYAINTATITYGGNYLMSETADITLTTTDKISRTGGTIFKGYEQVLFTVSSVSINNGGSLYPTGSTVTYSGQSPQTVTTSPLTYTTTYPASAATFTNGNYGFTSNIQLNFSGGATGTAYMNYDYTPLVNYYTVSSIAVNSGGSNYTSAPTVSFSGGGGSGATATASVSAATPGTYVSYMFASTTGLSKVGTYTGNGTSLNIDCSFGGGSRFILIKRSDGVGNWYCWDNARGITSIAEPYLTLNTTDAEVTTSDSITPYSAGFTALQNATTNINVTNANYIYLAVA